jgi:hypothetical protein
MTYVPKPRVHSEPLCQLPLAVWSVNKVLFFRLVGAMPGPALLATWRWPRFPGKPVVKAEFLFPVPIATFAHVVMNVAFSFRMDSRSRQLKAEEERGNVMDTWLTTYILSQSSAAEGNHTQLPSSSKGNQISNEALVLPLVSHLCSPRGSPM